jgi:Protein of unknown function (DUF2878)
MHPLVNIVINQIIWFLCVLGGNGGVPFALPLLVANVLLSHHRQADLQMMGMLLAAGVCIDGALQATGFFSFRHGGVPIPLWLAVIWLALAALPHHSLKWMKGRPLLSVLFGALGGPLAYWAGVRLGAAAFHWPLLPSLALLAAIWAVLWVGVMYWAGKQVRRVQ